MATSLLQLNRPLGLTGANKIARKEISERWKDESLYMVSGKTLISRVSAWAHDEFGVGIGAMAIARAFRAHEIPTELRAVITSIEEGIAFQNK
jgi:hypothetical protein